MFWLLRRGVEHQDVYDLLSATFTPEEATAALEAKWVDGMVRTQRTIDVDWGLSAFDRVNKDLNITLGMTEEEKKDYEGKLSNAKDTTFNGKSNLSLGSTNQNWGGKGTV